MEPSPARPRDRRGLSAAVPVLPVARRNEWRAEAKALADLWPRRTPGCGRLVDGGIRTRRANRGFAISACDPPSAGAFDLRCNRLDPATPSRACAKRAAAKTEAHQRRVTCVDVHSTLSRCAGCGSARGSGLQHLAGHRRRVHSIAHAALVRATLVAQPV